MGPWPSKRKWASFALHQRSLKNYDRAPIKPVTYTACRPEGCAVDSKTFLFGLFPFSCLWPSALSDRPPPARSRLPELRQAFQLVTSARWRIPALSLSALLEETEQREPRKWLEEVFFFLFFNVFSVGVKAGAVGVWFRMEAFGW